MQSVLVPRKDIEENGYSIQAGQYVKLIEKELDFDLDEKMTSLKVSISNLLKDNKSLDLILEKMFEVK